MEGHGNSIELWKLIVSSLIIVIGWGIFHYLSQSRDIDNKRREIISGYLIEAYRNIENVCGRGHSLTEDQKKRIERAIADIQLFGSVKQIEAAKNFTEKMNRTGYDDPRELLSLLRIDLRDELKLPKVSDDPYDIIHWRLK